MSRCGTLLKILHVPQSLAFLLELNLFVHLNPGSLNLFKLETTQFLLFLPFPSQTVQPCKFTLEPSEFPESLRVCFLLFQGRQTDQ